MKHKKIPAILILTAMLQLLLFPAVYAASYIANDFTKTTPKNTALRFSAQDFRAAVDPAQSGSLTAVQFTQLTNAVAGTLRVGANALSRDETVPLASLDQLTFTPTDGYEGEAIFTWNAIFGSKTSPYPGAVIITVGSGDGASPIDNEEGGASDAPGAPDASDSPDAPDESDDPNPPENPENPDNPDDPNNPNTPDNPDNPDNPDEPENPNTPESPDPSDNPENPENPDTPENPNPPSDPDEGIKPLKYDDMDDHWAAYSAGLLATKGYIIGEEVQDRFFFYPEKVLSRIEFIIMVNSIFGVEPKDSTADNPFSDQNIPSYTLRYAIASYEAGIISGSDVNGALYLNPYDHVTRMEAVKILNNALKLEHDNTTDPAFADEDEIPEWGLQALKNMEGYGIIQGFEDNTFRPYSDITKAQAAEMLYQTLKYHEKTQTTSSAVLFVED